MNPEEWEALSQKNWVEPLIEIRQLTQEVIKFAVDHFTPAIIRPLLGILDNLESVRSEIEWENDKLREENGRLTADLAANDDERPAVPENDPDANQHAVQEEAGPPDGDRGGARIRHHAGD